MKKVAVILSGSGYLDGAEIRESVGVLWALARHKDVEVQCFAPDQPQHHVVDHLTGKEVSGEQRNVLTESARIARGNVKPLEELDPGKFDAIVMPGGFGAAKNLSDFAFKGARATVNPILKDILQKTEASGKPIGAACIAPAVVALSTNAAELTVGARSDSSAELEKLGHTHVERQPNEIHVDRAHRIVTTPAYMYDDAQLDEVFEGIRKMVDEVIAMTGSPA